MDVQLCTVCIFARFFLSFLFENVHPLGYLCGVLQYMLFPNIWFCLHSIGVAEPHAALWVLDCGSFDSTLCSIIESGDVQSEGEPVKFLGRRSSHKVNTVLEIDLQKEAGHSSTFRITI